MPAAQPSSSGLAPPPPHATSPADGPGNAESGSKFKRFLKKFGRRPSDDTGHHYEGREEGGNVVGSVVDKPAATTGTTRSSKGSKPSTPKGKRSDSLAGRFFPSSSSNAQGGANGAGQNGANGGRPPLPAGSPSATNALNSGFAGGASVNGLASTLVMPSGQSSQAPQLDGVPHHDPLAATDVLSVDAAATSTAMPTKGASSTAQDSSLYNNGHSKDLQEQNLHGQDRQDVNAGAGQDADLSGKQAVVVGDVLSQQSSYDSNRSRNAPSFDNDSTHGTRVRDSVDNQTVDTGKSRASTKPTTLMSMDTRETAPGGSNAFAPMAAQIAQHRHGDVTPNQHRQAASDSRSGGAPSVIQFASAPPMGRSASGTIVQLPGQGEPAEDAPYTNVPSLSRPHPSNNPHPSGVPADNASVLTLASSTAAASIVGGGASSRGHQSHYAAPSFGGARSIGGSFMGDRRNSSDTYASLKALPPLSRRGSDSSTRTGRSIAASATGRSSAQAMMGAAAVAGTGPGAPADRISIHRTPSQRTIATQLSIPLSNSNVALAVAGQPDQQHSEASVVSGHLAVVAPQPSSALGPSPLAVPALADSADGHSSTDVPAISTHSGRIPSINASNSHDESEPTTQLQ